MLSFWLVVLLVLGLILFLLKVGSSYSRGSLITFGDFWVLPPLGFAFCRQGHTK